MRTPEVEIAISNTKAGMYCTDDADTLATEVERLEKANAELIAETHRWSAADKESTRLRDEQRRELLQRAEAAERRVALLIHTVAQLSAVLAEAGAPQDPANAIEMAAWAQSVAKAEARVRELETQHARLRAALERLDALYISEFDHEDRPPRPQWLQEALNGEEAK